MRGYFAICKKREFLPKFLSNFYLKCPDPENSLFFATFKHFLQF